jgi:hypothetical protein
MRPGLQEEFERETSDLFDKSIPYAVRVRRWSRLVHMQTGCVRIYEDGTIVSPIDPEDIKDSKEYLEQLKQLRVSL